MKKSMWVFAMKNKILKLAAILMILGPITAKATTVTVGTNDWMQPLDTVGFSWNDIAGVCDSITGVCGTSLLGGTVDLSGWTWANVNDVGALFMVFNPNYPGGASYANQISSTWAPLFLTQFQPTETQVRHSNVLGFTRTLSPADPPFEQGAYIMYISDNTDSTAQYDTMGAYPSEDLGVPYSPTGAWFYRATPSSIVPVPAAAWLFGSGLLGLVGMARRKKAI